MYKGIIGQGSSIGGSVVNGSLVVGGGIVGLIGTDTGRWWGGEGELRGEMGYIVIITIH